MKTMMVVLSVALLLLVSAGLALAAPPSPKEKPDRDTPSAKVTAEKRQAVAGVVQSKGSDTFVVTTKRASVMVSVTGDTRFSVKGKADAGLGDVSVGSRVNVQGTQSGDNLVARRVHVIPGRPAFWHAVGEVTAYSQGTSITVKNRFNVLSSFVLTGDTRIVVPEGHPGLAVGDWVTVVGTRAETPTITPTAKSIVVHKKQR